MLRLKRTLRGGLSGSILVLAVVALSGGASRAADVTVAAPALRHPPIHIHHVRDATVGSTNWSGYAVTGTAGSVTDVRGSWVVPAIQGSCPSTNQYASFWVGIDGFNSNTVEQTGTDSDCQNGVPTYYAWFEFYPHPLFIINSLTIGPGDVMSAEVHYNPGARQFTVTITNVTTGQTFSTTTKVNRAQRSSAEWIAEAPSSAGGILPLADFGTAVYGTDHTKVDGTNDATVSGTTAPIGSFSKVWQIDMVSVSDGTTVKAAPVVPPGLSSTGSFADAWASAGP